VECPRLGDDGRLTAAQVTRGQLAAVIAPRIEETFELVARQLEASPLRTVLPRRIVLTGGASQLKGVREVAQRVLGCPVRLAKPVEAAKIGETFATPAFSTSVGLLTYPLAGLSDAGRGGAAFRERGSRNGSGLIGRTYEWLRENF
jgi:cell division protein FtsA